MTLKLSNPSAYPGFTSPEHNVVVILAYEFNAEFANVNIPTAHRLIHNEPVSIEICFEPYGWPETSVADLAVSEIWT